MDEINDLLEDLGDDVEVIYLDDDTIIDEDGDQMQAGDQEFQEEPVEVVDLSKLTFKGHNRSVFSCDLSADGQLAVTGGEDDIAYVWSTASGEVYMECTGHKDSVTEVSFNHDNTFVATGDMGGLIQVWSVKEKKLIWCYEGDDLEWLCWHHVANVLVAGMQSGDIFVWQIPQGHCKVMASHGVSTACGEILSDGKKLLVGYTDGLVKLWDIKSASVEWQLSNFDDITAVACNAKGSLVAVAPSSQVIKVADGKIVGQYLMSEKADIEAITFDNDQDLLITGSLMGKVCIWDIAKQTLRHQAEIGFAITTFKWGSKNRLLVSTVDGAIYVCDVRTWSLVEKLTGHKDDVLSMCVSQDKTFVLTTSDDCTAKIFNLKVD